MNIPVEIAFELRAEIAAAAVRASSPWVTVKDAANYLGVSERTVREMQWNGKLAAFKVDDGERMIRFLKSDLDALMKPVSAASGQPPADLE